MSAGQCPDGVEHRVGGRRRRLCVCTRVHSNNADRPVDLGKVREFVAAALAYADSIAIAVGPTPVDATTDADDAVTLDRPTTRQQTLLASVSRAAREAQDARDGSGQTATTVAAFEVTPWGKFIPALNSLLSFAARDQADLVMFQSLETTLGADAASEMDKHLGAKDLVVGAALPGHNFEAGEAVELTGVTTPWNTLALWDVRKLAKSGFLPVAEGVLPDVPAGVEEVTAIATLQALMGVDEARAKLVRLPQVHWQTDWADEGRRRWHESKMASKIERAHRQMQALGVKSGVVQHV